MYLFKNKERVVPRDELLSRVWNYRVDLNLNSRTVDTHVTRLRRKLQKAVGTDAAVIVAVAKIGYRYLGQASGPVAAAS
jgi:DNA-binding response OmpR family regulator